MADKTPPSGNALLAFDSEGVTAGDAPAAPAAHAAPPPAAGAAVGEARKVRNWFAWFVAAVLAIVGITATTSMVALGPMGLQIPGVQPAALKTGRVTFETVPAGTEVLVDGASRGFTPLTLRLDPGHYDATLRKGSEERQIALEINAGGAVLHRVEFAAPAPTLSKLSVVTEPPGARVVVDGDLRGVSPINLADMAPGRHRIVVTGNGSMADRTVTTEAGVTTSVMFSLTGPAEVTAGWLGIDAPFEVRAIEKGEVIGTNASAKIMMSPGNHDIDFVNTTLGYQTRRRVDVASGRTATVKLDARVPVNINANPWAEVTVDGMPVGITPLANLVLTLGHHTVLFRHNELGEQRQDIVVTVPGPNRFTADLAR